MTHRTVAATLAAAILALTAPTSAARQIQGSSPQSQSSSAALEALLDDMLTRPAGAGRGAAAARPDNEALLARLKAIDPSTLSFDDQIDRRFAETILIGRLVSAPAGQPMGEAAYTRMLREQHLLPYDAAGLWAFARAQFDATVRELEALARTIDPKKTWR